MSNAIKPETNPKPSTLPVLGERHVQTIQALIRCPDSDCPACQPVHDLESVATALVSGTHKLVLTGIEGEVMVPVKEILTVSDALGRHDDDANEIAQEHFHRWLTTSPTSPETET